MQSLKCTPSLLPSPTSSGGDAQQMSAAENDSWCFQAREPPIDHGADLILKEASLFTVSRNRVTLSACDCQAAPSHTHSRTPAHSFW